MSKAVGLLKIASKLFLSNKIPKNSFDVNTKLKKLDNNGS